MGGTNYNVGYLKRWLHGGVPNVDRPLPAWEQLSGTVGAVADNGIWLEVSEVRIISTTRAPARQDRFSRNGLYLTPGAAEAAKIPLPGRVVAREEEVVTHRLFVKNFPAVSSGKRVEVGTSVPSCIAMRVDSSGKTFDFGEPLKPKPCPHGSLGACPVRFLARSPPRSPAGTSPE